MMSSGDEYGAEPVYTDMLKDICDISQYQPSRNRREARYRICDHSKQRQVECKEMLLSKLNMGNGLYQVFKAVVNEISRALPILGESGSEVSYFIPEPRNFSEINRLS